MRKMMIAAGVVALGLAGAGVWASNHAHQHGHGQHGGMTGQQHGQHGGMSGHQHGQQHGGGHAGHGAAEVPADASASTRAYIEANNRMHEGMDIAFTGDADVDFILGMIPHHQGAVEMAEIVLEYGSDAAVRELAEAVIAAQNEEIEWMRAWLAERGH